MAVSDTVALVLGLASPTAALGGLWLARLIDRGDENRRWKRDRRADSYAEIVRVHGTLIAKIRSEVTLDESDFQAWIDAVTNVQIFGSRAAELFASDIADEIHEAIDDNKQPDTEVINHVYAFLLSQIREELKLEDRITLRERWQIIRIRKQLGKQEAGGSPP